MCVCVMSMANAYSACVGGGAGCTAASRLLRTPAGHLAPVVMRTAAAT